MEKNEKYREIKAKHPEWSEEQIWTAVSLDMESDRVIDEAGDNIQITENLVKQILQGARQWLRDVLPQIYLKVASFFDKAISTIGEWIYKGIKYLKDLINILFDTTTTFPY